MGHLGLTLNLFLAALGTAALLVLVGTIYQRVGRSNDARRFPPFGCLIDIGDASLHVYTIGEGSPPVVFEAGIAATSLSWQLVQPEIAKFTKTASYDRAGLGWSGASLQPLTVWHLADELRTAMNRADIPKPRTLVAHSYGALVVIAYAVRHPSEIAGMVLVDPVATCEWGEPSESHLKTLRRGILLSRRGALLARLGDLRDGTVYESATQIYPVGYTQRRLDLSGRFAILICWVRKSVVAGRRLGWTASMVPAILRGQG